MPDSHKNVQPEWHPFHATAGHFERIKPPNGIPAEYLLMCGVTGCGGWESAPFSAKCGRELVLTWFLKCIGQGGYTIPEARNTAERDEFEYWDKGPCPADSPAHDLLWHHFADFIGVEAVWRDQDQKIIGTRRYPMAVEPFELLAGTQQFDEFYARRSDMAADWAPVWLRLPPPAGAENLVLRFLIESRSKADAEIAIGDIILSAASVQTPPAKGLCRFVIRTVEPATKKFVPSRISMTGAKAGAVSPSSSFSVKASKDFSFFYSPTGEIAVDVPVDAYSIEAVAGSERIHAMAHASHVRKGDIEIVELELPLAMPMRANRWHAGDHHLHLSGHATKDFPMMDPETAISLGIADGQDYFPFQAGYFTHRRRFSEQFRTPDAIGCFSTEVVNHVWGHFCVIPGNKPVEPPIDHFTVYPTMYDMVKAINNSGGACVAAHPFQMICQPRNTVVSLDDHASAVAHPGRFNCAKELPLILLHGEPCLYDLLLADGAGQQTTALREYYRLLNFGFRLGVGGSTDTGIDSAACPYPSCKTYVHANSLSFTDVSASYRAGKTFATNGPAMRLTVNGKGIGDTVSIGNNRSCLDVCVEVFSPYGLAHVELVFNGNPVARAELSGRYHAFVELKAPVREPGWLAAIVRGPGNRWVNTGMWPGDEAERLGQIAHSSPIYVECGEKPFIPSEELAGYYLRWLGSLRTIAAHYRPRLGRDAEKAGLSEKDAWDIIVSRIEDGEQRISGTGKKGLCL
jgi:hypothetical protein